LSAVGTDVSILTLNDLASDQDNGPVLAWMETGLDTYSWYLTVVRIVLTQNSVLVLKGIREFYFEW
jgi:hypothetical protein